MPSLRYAVRSLGREPGLALGVITTFALAVGATAAMYGLVTRLMLGAPPGVADPAQVARVVLEVRTEDGEQFPASTTSVPVFQALSRSGAFASVAAVYPTQVIVGEGADAREVSAIAASGDYFRALRARPSLGRLFAPSDAELPASNPVAVLSYAYFRRAYGGDAGILNQTILVDGNRLTVIGVAAPNFSGDGIGSVDLFLPLGVAFRGKDPSWFTNAELNLVAVIARLAPGRSPVEAAGLAADAVRGVPTARAQRLGSVTLESLLPAAVRSSPAARIARWLFGVSLTVMLIATANVGTLLLLRTMRKRRDVAVRLALGAGRGRLAGQLTLESLLLAGAGGAVGLFLSHRLSEVARATLLPTLAPTDSLVDPGVLLASVILSLGAGVVAGVAPLAFVSSRRLASDLQGAGTLGSAGRSRSQRVLVGVQVALCTVLLVGAGLFVRSLQRVQSQNLGFSPERLVFAELDFRDPLSETQQDELYRAAVRRLARSPGIRGATVVDAMPFGSFHVPPISVPGLNEPPTVGGQPPFMYGSTPEYLRLLGVSLLQGRLFDAGDRSGSPLVVIVNETMAREVWPGQQALGKCVRLGFDPTLEPTMLAPTTLPCREVVGVVRDSRARSLRPVNREASLMQYYVPYEQLPPPPFSDMVHVHGLLVGVNGDVNRMSGVVQRLIQGALPTPVYARVRPYQDLLDPQLRPWRLGATLFVLFGGLALGISAVGLFGVISYLVTQRTKEIGLRLALGGTGAAIGRSVVTTSLRMVGIGVAVGVAIAALAGPSARAMLFETSPFDPAVLAAACVTLVVVTALAAAWPAWRAARVSPMTALRVD